MKYFSFLLVAGGMLCMLAGIKERVEMERKEERSLENAYILLNQSKGQEMDERGKKGAVSGEQELEGVIGLLTIPTLSANLPVVEGTQEEDLKRGVGHFKESALPGEKGQIVFSGHRDTVFRKIGLLKTGDELVIKMPYGEFFYEITHTKIVDAGDSTVIQLNSPNEELVLSTCYPFSYIGSAPERYIIFAKPILRSTF